MFDNVGRNQDEDVAKRSALTVVLAALFGGAAMAFLAAWGAYTALEAAEIIQTSDDEMVEVVVDETDFDDTPPPPPPPPPPPSAADDEEEDEEEDEEDDTKVETETEVEQTTVLEDKVEDKIKSVTKPKGQKDGVEDGVEGGEVGGVKDGVKDGVVGGQLGGAGIRVVHSSKLKAKVRPTPQFPKDVTTGARCKVRILVDEKGIPYKWRIYDSCPKAFHPGIDKALQKTRYYPYKEGRVKVKAETTILYNFTF